MSAQDENQENFQNENENFDVNKSLNNIEDYGECRENSSKTGRKMSESSERKNRSPFEFNFEFTELFTSENVKEIHESINPKQTISQILEERAKNNNKSGESQTNLLLAQAEFHYQNLNFLEGSFKGFPESVILKLLNVLALLMNLNEEEYNINYDESQIAHLDPNLKKYAPVPEPDYSYIANRKLMEVKLAILKYDLVLDSGNRTSAENFSRDPEETNDNFYLNTEELEIILNYIDKSYFPNIRLFYHFFNINRITETKKIHVTVNRPLPVPPLSEAVEQVIEKNIIEEIANQKEEELALKEQKQREEQEKEKQEQENPEQVMEDILNRLNNENEVRKIVEEKVDEIKKDVEARILENNQELEKNVELMREQSGAKKK